MANPIGLSFGFHSVTPLLHTQTRGPLLEPDLCFFFFFLLVTAACLTHVACWRRTGVVAYVHMWKGVIYQCFAVGLPLVLHSCQCSCLSGLAARVPADPSECLVFFLVQYKKTCYQPVWVVYISGFPQVLEMLESLRIWKNVFKAMESLWNRLKITPVLESHWMFFGDWLVWEVLYSHDWF